MEPAVIGGILICICISLLVVLQKSRSGTRSAPFNGFRRSYGKEIQNDESIYRDPPPAIFEQQQRHNQQHHHGSGMDVQQHHHSGGFDAGHHSGGFDGGGHHGH